MLIFWWRQEREDVDRLGFGILGSTAYRTGRSAHVIPSTVLYQDSDLGVWFE
jgi:hypothetical protein